MSDNIKLSIKKILFGFSLLTYYIFTRNFDIARSSGILEKEHLYDSKRLLLLIDKLFIHTNKIVNNNYRKTIVKKNSNHIVICLTGLLDPSKKSHSSLYYSWAKMYLEADANNKVTFFFTNEHVYFKYFLTKNKILENEYFNDFKDLKYETNDSRFNYTFLKTDTYDLAINIKKSYLQIMDLSPTHLVFFSGVKCDSPFVRKTLFNFVPTIYHVTHDKHKSPSFAHLMIVARGRKEWKSGKLPILDIDNYFMGKKENIPTNLYNNKLIIEKFSNHKEPVVIATVLGGKRILNTIKSYSSEELNIFIDFIEKNNIVWYLIGIENEDNFRKLSSKINDLIDKEKLIVLKFKSAIDEFLKEVDIYCSLPRLIGGSGVAMTALNNKTVLICDSSSDVSRILEDKYIYDDFKTYFRNLEMLTTNLDKRLETMVSQNLYLNRFSENEIYKKTSDKLKKANKIFLNNSRKKL